MLDYLATDQTLQASKVQFSNLCAGNSLCAESGFTINKHHFDFLVELPERVYGHIELLHNQR